MNEENSTMDVEFCIKCYQLILSYTYREPCDVILSRYFYISIHLPFGYSIIWIEVTQLAMLIERTIAIFYVNKYESCTKTFGNSLFLLSILIPVLGCFYAYAGEKFRNPQISCINIPVTRSLQVNTLSIFLIGCHLLALIALAAMLCCSGRKSSAAQTLTSRFQLSENITSSRLLITLSATQLIIFFSYAISTVYLRFTFKPGGSLSLHNSNVLVAYLIPVYTFALPLITTIFLWRAKQSRRSEIQSMVRIPAFLSYKLQENVASSRSGAYLLKSTPNRPVRISHPLACIVLAELPRYSGIMSPSTGEIRSTSPEAI
ncbi:hypothetical protein NECAME_16797 [Necator americanus]|uniref:Uncharacterized protein n=1 Tax=Necator americanus TaxID=51031 RepID=W2TWD1_NECAM|nr:hypothetical protein NECAME_16797 [Necator americanus]ETN85366.1 hypothetical protein NECAME_16797 [Necator americanus]